MAAGPSVEDSIAAIERTQQDLQEQAQLTIAANLEQLSVLQQRLEEDRARLAKQQRRTRSAQPAALNAADIEQQRVLETEVNELRRRRDTARDANTRTERKLAVAVEECERLQHILDTPAGTAFPARSARAAPKLTPSERLDASLRNIGGGMRAGPAGAAMRASLQSSSARGIAGGGVSLAASGGALADRLAMEKRERELAAAEERLAQAALKRDTYEHMAARLRLEKLSFDPRFNAAYAELQRERKRAASLRIASTEANQAMSNAEIVRRRTESRIAKQQASEKAALAEQQATLLATQQSVLHFEVSKLSRSQSAIRLDGLNPGGKEGPPPSATASLEPSSIYTDQPSATMSGARDGGGRPPSASASAVLDDADSGLATVWERLRVSSGVLEPIDLIHKALEQLKARTELEALEATTRAKLTDLSDEAESLARRRERSGSAAALAAGRRLERLHELVGAAEKELARSTAALSMSDAAVAAARKGVVELDTIAANASAALQAKAGPRVPQMGYVRLGDPLECESSQLPSLMQNAVDAILLCVRSADALAAAKAAVDDAPLPPFSPSTLAPAEMS